MKITRSMVRRAGWWSLALLFAATTIVALVYFFWAGQKPPAPVTAKCSYKPGTLMQSGGDNPLKNTKLVNFTSVSNVDFLRCEDFKIGTGTAVKAGSSVTVQYIGAVAATGTIFESTLDSGQPATFSLDQTIPGFSTGLLGMKAGGERRILIPAQYAYGAGPPQGSGIPSNADLVFDISLLFVQ
ncbi:MAG: FKBP-type peptidyl-prolyl cis-trans isomerase [Candidatus Saccharimonadales bacterium]